MSDLSCTSVSSISGAGILLSSVSELPEFTERTDLLGSIDQWIDIGVLLESALGFIAVKDSGEPMELKPMNAADRRIVHKVASEAGLETESVGEGRDRHIVLKPSAKE